MALDSTSAVGRTRTLPLEGTEEIKLAVVYYANFSAGFFRGHREISRDNALNAVVHLSDYLYEYGDTGYASEDAKALGRSLKPSGELVSLADYRVRYAEHRSELDLHALHAVHPMIGVWDDHEVASDAWREGAENHSEGEGQVADRLFSALRAYAGWMPLRPPLDSNPAH